MGARASTCKRCYQGFYSGPWFSQIPPKCTICVDFHGKFTMYMMQLDEYKKGEFSPLHRGDVGCAKGVNGDVIYSDKYTPKSNCILTLTRSGLIPKENAFWHIAAVGPFDEFQVNWKIAAGWAPELESRREIPSDKLAIPEGVCVIVGQHIEPYEAKNKLYGGGEQVFVPPPVAEILWPLSIEFLKQPRTTQAITQYIENSKTAVKETQDAWWEEYEAQKRMHYSPLRSSAFLA